MDETAVTDATAGRSRVSVLTAMVFVAATGVLEHTTASVAVAPAEPDHRGGS